MVRSLVQYYEKVPIPLRSFYCNPTLHLNAKAERQMWGRLELYSFEVRTHNEMYLTFERKVTRNVETETGSCNCRYDLFRDKEWIGAFEYFLEFSGFVIGPESYKIAARLNFPWFIPLTRYVVTEKSSGRDIARLKGSPFPSSMQCDKQRAYGLTRVVPTYTPSWATLNQKLHYRLSINRNESDIDYHLINEFTPNAKLFYTQNLKGEIIIPGSNDLVIAFAGLHLLEIAIGNVPHSSSSSV